METAATSAEITKTASLALPNALESPFQLWSLLMREKFNLSEDFHVYKAARLPESAEPAKAFRFTGMVCRDRISRGKNRGELRWSTADRGSRRTEEVPIGELRAWTLSWSGRTGLCGDCLGRRALCDEACETCCGTGLASPISHVSTAQG